MPRPPAPARRAAASRAGRAGRRARATTITSTPIAISCQNGLTSSRSSPLRITPMISAPAITLTTRPRPPKKLAPPMITAVIASSSSSWPACGEPASVRPATRIAGDAGRQPAQHVDGEQHAVDRDAGPARARPGCRRPRRSSGPTACARAARRRAATASTATSSTGTGMPADGAGAERPHDRRQPGLRLRRPRPRARAPRTMPSVPSVTMNGFITRPATSTTPLSEPDRRAGQRRTRSERRRAPRAGADHAEHAGERRRPSRPRGRSRA